MSGAESRYSERILPLQPPPPPPSKMSSSINNNKTGLSTTQKRMADESANLEFGRTFLGELGVTPTLVQPRFSSTVVSPLNLHSDNEFNTKTVASDIDSITVNSSNTTVNLKSHHTTTTTRSSSPLLGAVHAHPVILMNSTQSTCFTDHDPRLKSQQKTRVKRRMPFQMPRALRLIFARIVLTLLASDIATTLIKNSNVNKNKTVAECKKRNKDSHARIDETKKKTDIITRNMVCCCCSYCVFTHFISFFFLFFEHCVVSHLY